MMIFRLSKHSLRIEVSVPQSCLVPLSVILIDGHGKLEFVNVLPVGHII